GEAQKEQAVLHHALAVFDRGQELLLQVHHHEGGPLRAQETRGLRRGAHAASQGRRAAQARTASKSASRWPAKKWSDSGTTTSSRGGGSRSTKARKSRLGPNSSLPPCTG